MLFSSSSSPTTAAMCHKQRGCQSTRTVGAISRLGGKKAVPFWSERRYLFKSFSMRKNGAKLKLSVPLPTRDPLCFLMITVLAFVIIIIVVAAVRFGSTGFNFDRRQWRWRRVFNTPSRGEAITQGRGRWGGIRDRVARGKNLIPSFPSIAPGRRARGP